MKLKPYAAFVDTNLMEAELLRISERREELKKEQAVLRTRQCRLKNLLQGLRQMPLEFAESNDEE